MSKNENGFQFSKNGGKQELTITATEVRMHYESGFACFKNIEDVCIPVSEVLFYDYAPSLFGILGFKIAGGNNSHFHFKGLSKTDAAEIREWLVSHGARFSVSAGFAETVSDWTNGISNTIESAMNLGNKNENSTHVENRTYNHCGVHPFSKESISIMSDGVAHHRQGLMSNRDSYVPYDKIDFMLVSKGFFFSKRIAIVGLLSFATKDTFSNEVAKILKEELKKKGVNISDGKVYHPSIFSNVSQKSRISLTFLDDMIVFTDTRKFSNNKNEDTIILRNVTSYSCKPIFSLFNRKATITGTGSVDMRSGMATGYSIEFPGVFFFWWFCCGPIKAACKRLYK